MSELASNDSSATIVKDFVAKRYAIIYIEKLQTLGHEAAEDWIHATVAREDKRMLQKYIIQEMTKQGYTGIIPGDN